MNIKWNLRNGARTTAFLARQAIQSFIDRKLKRQRRDEAVLAYVEQHAARNNPAAVLAAMDEYAIKHRWLMNIGPNKGQIMIDALQAANAGNVLEIGAYCGYSATLIGSFLAERGGKLTSIEISARHAAVARQVVAHAGLAKHVEIRTGTLSSEIASLPGPFDGVLLDHWKDEYLPDLKRLEAAGMLHAGTVVIADNVGFFAVPDYLGHVRQGGRYKTRFIEASVEYNPQLKDGVEVSVFTG